MNKICKLYKWSKKKRVETDANLELKKFKETHRLYTFVNEIIKIENIHGKYLMITILQQLLIYLIDYYTSNCHFIM